MCYICSKEQVIVFIGVVTFTAATFIIMIVTDNGKNVHMSLVPYTILLESVYLILDLFRNMNIILYYVDEEMAKRGHPKALKRWRAAKERRQKCYKNCCNRGYVKCCQWTYILTFNTLNLLSITIMSPFVIWKSVNWMNSDCPYNPSYDNNKYSDACPYYGDYDYEQNCRVLPNTLPILLIVLVSFTTFHSLLMVLIEYCWKATRKACYNLKLCFFIIDILIAIVASIFFVGRHYNALCPDEQQLWYWGFMTLYQMAFYLLSVVVMNLILLCRYGCSSHNFQIIANIRISFIDYLLPGGGYHWYLWYFVGRQTFKRSREENDALNQVDPDTQSIGYNNEIFTIESIPDRPSPPDYCDGPRNRGNSRYVNAFLDYLSNAPPQYDNTSLPEIKPEEDAYMESTKTYANQRRRDSYVV